MKTITRILVAVILACSVVSAGDDPLSTPEMRKLAQGAVELGWKYFHKGDSETALKRFEMATRHDKTCAPGYYGMAYVYSIQGKLDDAIKYYRLSLKYDQTYPYTFANLGFALLQKEQFDEALKVIDKALQLDPKCGEAHLSYANYHAYKRDWKRAGESANKAIKFGQKLHPEFRKLLEKEGAKLKAEQTSPANGGQLLSPSSTLKPPEAGPRR